MLMDHNTKLSLLDMYVDSGPVLGRPSKVEDLSDGRRRLRLQGSQARFGRCCSPRERTQRSVIVTANCSTLYLSSPTKHQ